MFAVLHHACYQVAEEGLAIGGQRCVFQPVGYNVAGKVVGGIDFVKGLQRG